MLTYSNFGETTVEQAAREGFDGLRFDVPNEGDLTPLVAGFIEQPLRPLFLLHDIARNEPLLDVALPLLGPAGFDIEVFNEPPGLDKVTDQQYVDGIRAVHHDCRARGMVGRVISGGLANLSRENIDRLRWIVPQLPADVTVGFHRYSYKTQTDPSRPWPPFQSREQELNTLHAIANGRQLACTEFGYHTAAEQEGVWIFAHETRLTDEQVYQFLVDDLRFYARQGVVLAAIYQWRDGAQDVYIDRYGLHTADGQPKRQLDAVRDWRV